MSPCDLDQGAATVAGDTVPKRRSIAMTRLTRSALALGAVASLALSGAGAAQARHGADDPAGHDHGARQERVHHHRHHHGDRARAARHGADDRAGHQRREDGRHGADDPAGDDHGAR
jgi:hypothetical protein